MFDEKNILDTIKLFQALIRINTINELKNEEEAALYLQSFFNKYEIPNEIVYSDNQRASIIAQIDGLQKEEPIVLLSHLDVVDVNVEEWIHPPLSGVIEDGVLWGRGTLDTKQLTAMHVAIMQKAKELAKKGQLQRTLIFVSAADEENGGTEGMEFIARKFPEYFEGATVFSEGGGFIVKNNNNNYMFVASGEKGTAKLRLKVSGEGGHAGAPPADQALLTLATGLKSLLEKTFNPITYPILNTFEELLFQQIEDDGKLDEDEVFITQMRDYMRFPTVTIDKVQIGQQINIVPYYAEADIEIRTLPMVKKDEVLYVLNRLFETESIDWELLSFQGGYESDVNHSLLQEFEEISASRDYPITIIPFTALGKTDGRFICHLAKNIYGISPTKIAFTEVLRRVHNNNERIELDSFVYGLETLAEVVIKLATKEVA